MSVHSFDRSAVTIEKTRYARTSETDRTAHIRQRDRCDLCSFTFADGRQCRTPRRDPETLLCTFHARKEAQALAGQQVGQDIARQLSSSYVSACDVSSTLARVFSAVAQGQVKPKTAATLGFLAQTLVQTIPLAQREFIHAFGMNTWRSIVAASFTPSTPEASSTPPTTPPSSPPILPAAPSPERASAASTASTPNSTSPRSRAAKRVVHK